MSKELYQEALADVKKLKEVAEDNAKRALLEAVTPRIRDLIENQLMGENEPEDDLLMDEVPGTAEKPEIEEPAEEEFDVKPVVVSPEHGDSSIASAAISMPDAEGKVTLDLDALQPEAPHDSDDEFELDMNAVGSLDALNVSKPYEQVKQFESKLLELGKTVKRTIGAGKLIRESKGYSEHVDSIISEIEDMYEHLQDNLQETPKKKAYETLLESHYSTLRKLMEQKMNKKNKTLTEADVTLKLTGLPDDVDLDSVGVDLITGEEGDEATAGDEGDDLDLDDTGEEPEGDEGGEEEGGDLDLDLDAGGDEEDEAKMESKNLSDDTVVEIDEGMLRREIKRMRALRESDEGTKPNSWGHGAGEVADGFEDEDMGDPIVDVELTTESDDAADEDEEDLEEADDADGTLTLDDEQDDDLDELDQATDHSNDDPQTDKQNRMPESYRRRLAAELKIQTEAKAKAIAAKKAKEVALKNGKRSSAKKMDEAYTHFARKYNASVERATKLKGMLAEATSRKGNSNKAASTRSAEETKNLRTKLAETNLFNAKLLYTNKLLQNESLTKRQKAEVIERLDEARSEREVKLVYESLTKTLQSTKSSLTESKSAPVIGSSSRATRPASSNLNEGIETDRWARLAGIK